MQRMIWIGVLMLLGLPQMVWAKGAVPKFDGKLHYVIVARHSGKCLDCQPGKKKGLPVYQHSYWGGHNQQWKILSAGKGYYKIKARHNGLLLDVNGAGKGNGVGVIQWSDHNNPAQQWKFVPVGDGYYKLQARHSGKFLDVFGGEHRDAAPVGQWGSHPNHNQQWKVICVEKMGAGDYTWLMSKVLNEVGKVQKLQAENKQLKGEVEKLQWERRQMWKYAPYSRNLLPPVSSIKPHPPWKLGANKNGPTLSKVVENGRTWLTAVGNNKNAGIALWRGPDFLFSSHRNYVLAFECRGKKTSGFLYVGVSWQPWCDSLADWSPPNNFHERRHFSFRIPPGVKKGFIYVATYGLVGKAQISGIRLFPVKPVHQKWGELELGEGEILENGKYVDLHNQVLLLGTIHRTLHSFQSATSRTIGWGRWIPVFKNSSVVYRNHLPYTMKSAQVTFGLAIHKGRELQVQASNDGKLWYTIGTATKGGTLTYKVPPVLLKKKPLFIRFIKTKGADWGVDFNHYKFQAEIDYRGPRRVGRTLLIPQLSGNSNTALALRLQQQAKKVDHLQAQVNRLIQELKVVKQMRGKIAPKVQEIRRFLGSYQSAKMTIDIAYTGGKFTGSLTRKGTRFPFTAGLVNRQMVGSFHSGNNVFTFRAWIKQGKLHFKTGKFEDVLSRK